MKVDTDNLAISGGKLLMGVSNEWVKGWQELQTVQDEPTCEWKGSPLSEMLWFKILNFFRWSQRIYKAESQVRLYYNRVTKQWDAYPHKQSPSGMTTNDETIKEARERFDKDWTYLGTAHHHCTAGAFQSGTDEDNEKNQDGFHYTIGNLDKDFLDYHGRFSWAGILYPAYLSTWVEKPKWINQVPEAIRTSTLWDYFLSVKIANDKKYNFPEEWKASIKPKQQTTLWPHRGSAISGGYYGYGNHTQNHYGGSKKEEEKEDKEDRAIEAIITEVDTILFDVGFDAESVYKTLTKTAEEFDHHDEFLENNLNLALQQNGMDSDEFKRKIVVYLESIDNAEFNQYNWTP